MLFRRIFSSAMASVLRPATYAPYDGGRRHSHAPRQRNRGLMIEPLEQRQLLSVCQWTGAAGNGDWSNAANWLKNQIPTASDDAVIRGASKPVVIPATAIQNKAIAVDGLELDDSTLDVEGELTIGGMFQWSDYAKLKGAGHTTAQGGISFGGSIVFLDGETLTNQGTALLADQKLQLLDKATFVNAAGTLLDIHDDALINVADGSSAAIQNAGTLRKSGGTDTTAIYPAFNNTGIFDVETGELELIGNETGNGTFNVNAPGQLAFVNRVGEARSRSHPRRCCHGQRHSALRQRRILPRCHALPSGEYEDR